MVPRENKNNAQQNLRGPTKSIMVFSEMAYFLPSKEVRNNREELSSIQLESVKSGHKVLNDYIFLYRHLV